MKKGSVLLLGPSDVVKTSLKKNVLDIDFLDLVAESRKAVEKTDLAIFSDQHRGVFKVIKDRWGIGAVGTNIIK